MASKRNKKNGNGVQPPIGASTDAMASPEAEAPREPSPPHGKAAYWLEQVDGEVDRLRNRWSEAQAEIARCEARNRELEHANGRLRADVNELQGYIDGRKDHWAEMQKRIEQYEDTLAGMEQVVRDAEDKLSRKDGEQDLLSERVIELERRCAELAGRLQERERSQREDQRRLNECTDELEGTRDALTRAERAAEEAASKAKEQATLVEALERCVARRDKTIEELERTLEEQRESAKSLEADKNEGIARLEQELAARKKESTELRELREQLADQARQLERLSAERGELEGRANEANQRLAALEQRRSGAGDEVRSLRHELVAQQLLIDKLETELDSKQGTIDTLRRQVDAPGRARNDGQAAPANGGVGNESASRAFENVEIIRIGELFRHASRGNRRPIALLEASDGKTYPVTKPSVTIGRASTNDICIRREFVSRTHARLIVRGIGAIIEDAGSKNGILVNSEPVGRRVLVDGDVVSLGGKLDLKYVELDTSPRPDMRNGEAETEI